MSKRSSVHGNGNGLANAKIAHSSMHPKVRSVAVSKSDQPWATTVLGANERRWATTAIDREDDGCSLENTSYSACAESAGTVQNCRVQ